MGERFSGSMMAFAALAFAWPSAASAEDVAAFYRDKTVSVVVGYGVGGGYDQAARVFARHFGAHVPGHPQVIVRNMPGAGSIVASNYIQSGAPRDGTVIGSANDAMLIASLIGLNAAQFDPREFGWLGSLASRGTPIVYVRADAPAATLAAAREKEDLLGATGPDATSSYPAMLNDLLGTRFKVVLGYKGGSSEINLAIERGEVHGRASWEWESLRQFKPDWLASGFVRVILQMGLRAHPDLPDVPVAIDLARDDEQRRIMELVLGTGRFLRAYSTPPGTPADRLAALRAAFAETVADPDFARDMSKVAAYGLTYLPPEEIGDFLTRVYGMSPGVVARAAKYVGE